MSRITVFAAVISAGTLMQGGTALAANMCKADTMSCSTAMPVGGYCECHAKGATQSGTVVAKTTSPGKTKTNSTAGGCGANPGSPGCR